ncbi:MAG: hypothetical protein WC805_01660 [Patescibacteria group bacterium]|jgi:hypothetical protein
MNIRKIVFLIALLLVLGAPSCKQDNQDKTMTVGQAAITTDVNGDNSPVLELDKVLDRAPVIYCAVEIINGTAGNQVEVTWTDLTNNKTIATEWFVGKRADTGPHDFIGDTSPTNSWLATSIALNEVSWPRGDYEVAIQLNRQLAKKIGFQVVSEQEFDVSIKKGLVKSLYLGEEINSQNQIISPQTEFGRTVPRIYAVALLSNVPSGTSVKAAWRHWESGRVISTYTAKFSGSGYLPFAMDLNRVGNQWPKGTYTVTVSVDNVEISSKDFTIE